MSEPILVIGGGSAGSTRAMYLLHAGLQAIIIESEISPRFHIGESLTTVYVDALIGLICMRN